MLAITFMVWEPGLLSAGIDNIPVSAILAAIAVEFASISPILPIVLIFSSILEVLFYRLALQRLCFLLDLLRKNINQSALQNLRKLAHPRIYLC